MRAREWVVGWGRPLIRGEVAASSLIPGEFTRGPRDKWLLGAMFGLLLFGVATIYSVTAATSTRPTVYLESHLIRILVGITAFLAGSRIDYHRWGRWAPASYFMGLCLLAMVYIPGFGHSAGNARRWLSFGGVTLQPADLARVGLVIYLAFLLSKPRSRLTRFSSGVFPCLVAVGLMSLLVVRQPNLSTVLALLAITGLMLVAAGIPWRHLLLPLAPVALVLPLVIRGYQSTRVANWLSYWQEGALLRSGNYQMDQSILAIGSGGVMGRGLGESRQKWFFLPDAHTDFIFAIVGEELGLLGATLLIGLIVILLWRAYEAARRAPDRFGYLLATGIGVSIAVYAATNLLVATGMIPTTGLPLPLVSYGGSAVVATLFSLGILVNIAIQGDASFPGGTGENRNV